MEISVRSLSSTEDLMVQLTFYSASLQYHLPFQKCSLWLIMLTYPRPNTSGNSLEYLHLPILIAVIEHLQYVRNSLGTYNTFVNKQTMLTLRVRCHPF